MLVSKHTIARLGQQVSSSKALAEQTTVLDTKLFITRLYIAKATSMDIRCIILISNSSNSTRKIVDLSVHSEQAHSLAICSILRYFFSFSLNYRIKFWNCSSNAE